MPLRSGDRAGTAAEGSPAVRPEPVGPGVRAEHRPGGSTDPNAGRPAPDPSGGPASNVRSISPGTGDQPTPAGEPAAKVVPHAARPMRHRYLIERPEPAGAAPEAPQESGSERQPAAGVSNTQPLPIRHNAADQPTERRPGGPEPTVADADRRRPGDAERPRPVPPDPFLGPLPGAAAHPPAPEPTRELTPQELLRPESVARLSESGRELLARLQAEMHSEPGTRPGGLTSNGGGNGTGPHGKIDPPDLAG